MNPLYFRFQSVLQQIREAEQQAQRPTDSVKLLAVSKTQSPIRIAQLYHCGQRHFGENYLQEAITKQAALSAFQISWHFIGPIQSNKTKAIASSFAWVHSVDRWKIAQRLNEQRPAHLPPLNICLQVNISHEASKSGIELNELADLVKAVSELPNLRLRGVMAIPSAESDPQLQRLPYQRLYQTVQALKNRNLQTFSFGMSGDLAAAIAEGATIVRIGTALFGQRN
ncbi:MAG: hypothetical protein RL637_567 [Pseudomonadota bacterium]|jgi:pyridoxal phosphate enzyme (YggS family)